MLFNARLQFGKKLDVALERGPNGSLRIKAKYLDVAGGFKVGKQSLGEYIGTIAKKREFSYFMNGS